MQQPITRRRYGKSFAYYQGSRHLTDQVQLERIKALAIPPAWREVQIARSARAKVQASGRDAAGRLQVIYNATYRAQQEVAKFARISAFAAHLPAMRRQVERDLARRKLSKDKVLAAIVRLMDQAYFRVGNQTYAKDNQTYGVTTLRSKHTDVHGDQVTFDFVGKRGQKHHKTITDHQLAQLIRRLDDLPGYEIFKYYDDSGQLQTVDSREVNVYIKQHMGEAYTAKDFRTWGGTLLATAELALQERADSPRERKKTVTSCVKKVARRLGNTPAVTRGSYIDPRIITAYLDSNVLADMQRTVADMKPHKYLKPEERCLLEILKTV